MESKQVKITVDSRIADAFKVSCSESGVSMTEVLSDYMSKHSKTRSEKKSKSRLSSKRQRRAAVASIIEQLEQIRDSESAYSERIPENLQSSVRPACRQAGLSLLKHGFLC
jgi:hypothetical protein